MKNYINLYMFERRCFVRNCTELDGIGTEEEVDGEIKYFDEKTGDYLSLEEVFDMGYLNAYYVTEFIFLNEDEAIQYGKENEEKYEDGWRVWETTGKGEIVEIIKNQKGF